jgi:hypothetical protein
MMISPDNGIRNNRSRQDAYPKQYGSGCGIFKVRNDACELALHGKRGSYGCPRFYMACGEIQVALAMGRVLNSLRNWSRSSGVSW